jgi:O-antigen/teichoic acid export membrane protein
VIDTIRELLRRQLRDPLNRDWATIFSGTLGRLLLGFVASILTARALGPEAFGIFATLAAIASIGGALADLGLNTAVVQRVAAVWPGDPLLARQRGAAFLRLRGAVALLLTLLSLAVSAPLATILPGHPDPLLVLLALLGLVATNLSGAVSALLQATSAFRSLALVLITNSALTALLAIGLAATGWLTIMTALAVLGILTSLVSLVLGWQLLPLWKAGEATPQLPEPRATWGALRAESAELLRFGVWVWVSNGLAMVLSSLDLLLLGRFLPPGPVGLYALASNLAGKADIVNHSLHAVLLPAAAQIGAGGEGALRVYLKRSLVRSAGLSLLLLPLVPLADLLIVLFYGPMFRPAVPLFQLLLGVAIIDVWVTPILLLAYALRRPGLLVGGDVLRIGALLASGALLIPRLGPSGAALARLCARVVGAVTVLISLRWALRQARAAQAAQPTPPEG